MKSMCLAGLCLGLALSLPFPATGSPGDSAAVEADGESAWTFAFTPYLWMAGIEGQVTLGEREGDPVHVDFSDLFDKLHFALMGTFEARHGRWGAVVDGIYIDLRETALPATPGEGEVDVELLQQVYQGGVAYRIVDQGAWTADILAGLRYLDLSFEAEVRGGIQDGEGGKVDRGWGDGVLGGRATYSFAERWSGLGYLDVGTGGSDLSWQGMLGIGYRISHTLSGLLVYRYLAYDFQEASAAFDLALGGPNLGLQIRF